MNKEINNLRNKFIKYNIDGYVVPKNDDYFTEYSKINRLKIISNFSGSAGLAIILKNKNYLFTDGRYTIQSEMESGKYFKIVSYEKIINCNLFKNLRLGLDPKLFTHQQIKNYFLKNNQIKFLSNNLIDEIKAQKVIKSVPFFSLKDEIVGENSKSKINKIVNYLKKNKADNLFVTAPENVAWILNIRGGDGPNSPVPNSRLIINKSKKIFLITEPYKANKLIKEKIINKNQLIATSDLPKKILALSGKNFIIDNKSCSVFYENIIKSKFKIIKREDPTYLLKAIKNSTEIDKIQCIDPEDNWLEKRLRESSKKKGIELVLFETISHKGDSIYHTDVFMYVGQKVICICFDVILPKYRDIVRSKVSKHHDVFEISEEQILDFCGNSLEARNNENELFLIMSSRAFEALNNAQKDQLSKYYKKIIHSDLTTIERYGGGSARCMLNELF